MSSACTPQRLVGRRVRRKFASCFFVPRIRLEEKAKAYSRKSPKTSNGSTVIDFTGGSEGRRESEKKGKENEGIPPQNPPSHSNRISGGEAEPHVADEDYLVFCFREDGAIEIVNDDEEHENTPTAAASQMGGEKSSKHEEEEEMKKNVEDEEPGLREMEQLESCDSNGSDTSSGSFAFPILKIGEWTGSPIHMPKNGNPSVRLHCCSF